MSIRTQDGRLSTAARDHDLPAGDVPISSQVEAAALIGRRLGATGLNLNATLEQCPQ